MSSTAITRDIRVMDCTGTEWSFNATGWVFSDDGYVHVERGKEVVASFERPVFAAFYEHLTPCPDEETDGD